MPDTLTEVLINGVRYIPADGIAAKAVQTDMAAVNVLKAVDERRYTLGVAYPAMKPDVGKAADGHRDFVSPEVLEQTAWNWMKCYRQINLFHEDGTSGHGEVVESYIWRADPWVIKAANGSEQTVMSGDWLMASVWDEYGWQLVKSGLINGWSPEGAAKRATPSPERLAQLRS